ncbi:SET domain [Macleaya cordata]|uniref:SET domain n=1 Tax=Macleaya cordata TaxID=56857 RepID=A0A200PPV6_MACCD|nr:SET domain [Macleaya cordata]
MSNRDKLELEYEDEDSGEILERIKEGGRLMSLARRMRDGDFEVGDEMKDDNFVEEIVLCQVLTNSVEVQVNEQRSLGIAIYGPNFSWINHSCSPNACYRFSVSGSELEMNYDESKLRIFASGEETVLKTWVCDESKLNNGICGYGPKIIVRTIKPIKKGEEVCIAYTDLLQPKGTRHSELWSKYRFNCCCWRCSASPPTYLDRVLQENADAHIEESKSSSDDYFYRNEAYKELINCMDDIISEYLSDGNPESCCEKLESMLTRSLQEEQPEEEQSLANFKLHPLHHLSLNAYITLASAYKIHANNLSALHSRTDDPISEVFELSKTSAAYYFLLAGVTHHLFLSESSLIAIAAHFWISAGESLLNLISNPMWNSSLNRQPANLISSSLLCNRWNKCMLMEKLEMDLVFCQSQSKSRLLEFEEISQSFLGCLSKILPPVWTFLIHGHRYFKYIKDPIDFSWLGITKNHNLKESQALQGSTGVGSSYFGRTSCCCRCEVREGIDEQKTSILQLGVHCLLYGGYLTTICYCRDCYLTSYVKNLLCQVDKQGC